ncbi:MAG TPA: cobalamin-independent methionine synthase II family protein [Acidimicrobiales bacterium]
MARNTDHILTTHAGSLPRPERLIELMWARGDGGAVDAAEFDAEIAAAVDDVVVRQREVGIELVGDGEEGKSGFNTYIEERFAGFGGRSAFVTEDLVPFPNLAARLFATGGMEHVVFSNCVGPVELKDGEAVHRDIANMRHALEAVGLGVEGAFLGAISPGQIAFHYPNQYYPSYEAYLEAVVPVLRYEYQAIIDAGFDLQIDSPDLAMAGHSHAVGATTTVDWNVHVPLAIEALNESVKGLPSDRLRLHVCWGNYGGPHNMDVPLRDIIERILVADAGLIYIEGGNPRHEHEWRVFEEVTLPEDKSIVLGVIDTKSNFVEHRRVVADRIVRLANVVGRERVIAATDCGFDTFIRYSLVDPGVAWLKLRALVEGAEIASAELW